ncbi:putative mannitol dehydrogenase [Acorus calamus]|uniref:cinnamyl-alcohol dehydrogenase n=1 Tax=Acorus calamus TaxID=4465 RepID=A0AAV9EQY5_ACOCL|nr:putative mannitol dehydrogenase [Acorus calamus]
MSSPKGKHQNPIMGWAARDPSGLLSPFTFSRRTNGDDDITIKILYCGVCHTDLHYIRNDHGITHYPIVPGHEIAGVVTMVGQNVTKFKVGDPAGVGCMVDACNACESCTDDRENDCPDFSRTYGELDLSKPTNHGGYSEYIVVHDRYAVKFPDGLPLDGAAPLLCAGITVYSAMRYYGLDRPGLRVGVVGLGGLGHVAVKFAKAFGMGVAVISTTPSKKEEAVGRLGADEFLISRNAEQMKAAKGTLDGIIDTVSDIHPIAPLIDLLKLRGKLIVVGATDKPFELPIIPLLIGRRLVAGSSIGGMKETQEMVDFAGRHGITADVEVVPMEYINTAMDRLAKGDVKYRFVIDIGNTLKT